jgi:hypothetical protein
VLQRHSLRDHAAQREPHDVRCRHAAGIEHVHHVLHEVVERQSACDMPGLAMPAEV